MLLLKDKLVVVVGASSGLGKALSMLLEKEQVNLVLLSRTIESSNVVTNSLKINCDISNPTEIKNAYERIDSIGIPDYLINCAGIGLMKLLEETTDLEISNVITTNLTGTIISSREAYKRMKERGSGRIINVSSTSGFKPRAMEPVYSASKFGLKGFTESIKLAGQSDGIQVTGVYPGGMKSKNFWRDQPDKNISDYMEPEFVAKKIIDLMKCSVEELPHELIIERPKKI